MVNFSDLELESYHSRSFLASVRKEMFPGWVLALPPRPQMTSCVEGVVMVDRLWDDEDEDDGMVVGAVDDRIGEGDRWWESMEEEDGNDSSSDVIDVDTEDVLLV